MRIKAKQKALIICRKKKKKKKKVLYYQALHYQILKKKKKKKANLRKEIHHQTPKIKLSTQTKMAQKIVNNRSETMKDIKVHLFKLFFF